jgi:hypothetical protein
MDEPNRENCPFEYVPTPPEIIEHFRAAFNEAEFLEEREEMRRTGGYTIDDLMALFDEVDSDDRAA